VTQAAHAAIARAFVTARQQAVALPDYPGSLPQDLAEAYAIQDIALELSPAPVGGWKVGRIPAPLSDRFGIDRLAGPIFAPTIVYADDAPDGLIFSEGFGAAEAEYLLRVGTAPDPAQNQFTLEEAAAHIDAVHIGLEIASSPFPGINDFGPTVTISDFGNNNGLIIGDAVTGWETLTFAEDEVSTIIDDAVIGTGKAASFPDGLLGSVRFLLENLAARGIPLHVGSWISTGAVTGVHQVTLGQSVRADFGRLGSVECRIAAQPGDAAAAREANTI